jgi:glycosyltransferase involved in cell wall biosynthesis
MSVIIPACNEEHYLPSTLAAIQSARVFASEQQVDVIVVDNDSTDDTPRTAARGGAIVLHEPLRNIGRARNRGAAAARGECFVFVDADILIPERLFRDIARSLEDPACIGGAVDARQDSKRIVVQMYLRFWRLVGRIGGMAQGATQFCRREAFEELGGYDESLWMGEDVDFYWRMKKLARRNRGHVAMLRDVHVLPSPRRFDQWPLWKILVFTNPVFALLFRRRRRAWRDWYDQLIR